MDPQPKGQGARNPKASSTRANLISCSKNQAQIAHRQYGEAEAIPDYAQSHYPGAYHPVAQNVGTVSHNHTFLSATASTDATGPANEWLSRQSLEKGYSTLKRKFIRMIDPVAQQAVANMDITRFVQPTNPADQISTAENSRESLFPAGPPPEDLNYCLRDFLVVNPVRDPNAVFARIAVKERRTVAGYVPLIPSPRRIVTESEVEECSESCDGQ